MIRGATCRHCVNAEECAEGWREMLCSLFTPDWDAIEADPAVRRQGRAEKKRARKRARAAIAGLNGEAQAQ